MSGPARTLACAILVTAIGNGLYLAGAVLFLTRSVGLSGTDVGIGLTIAGMTGLGAGPVVGHLADHLGAREVYLVTLTAEALATGAWPWSTALRHSWWSQPRPALPSRAAERCAAR